MVTWRSFTLHVSSVILLWISINSQRQAVPVNVTPRTFCMFLGRLINFPTNGIARTLQRNTRSLTANKLEARHPQFPWQCRRTRQPAALPRFSSNHGFSRIRCEQGLTFEHWRRPRYAAKRLKKCLEGIKPRLSPRPIVQQAVLLVWYLHSTRRWINLAIRGTKSTEEHQLLWRLCYSKHTLTFKNHIYNIYQVSKWPTRTTTTM